MKLITKQKIKGEDVPVTTSLKVAEYFGKMHKHVIASIEDLVDENSATKNMFVISSYKNRGKDYKQYLLTQDGFTLLAMGFTGAKALEFKLAYIKAFNEMRVELENFRVNRQIAREGYKGLTGAIRIELCLNTEDSRVLKMTKKGKYGGTYVAPAVFVDIAMWLNPSFKAKVMLWVADNLLGNRNTSGVQYKLIILPFSQK